MAGAEVERVQIDMFSADQRIALQRYLTGAEIPYELTLTSVAVPGERSRDLYAVLERVAREGTEVDEQQAPRPRSPLQPPYHLFGERPVVTGGYRVASWRRRAAGALIDFLVLNTWTLLAHLGGSPSWAIVATLGLYTVGTTAVLGRTIGKYVAGTMVIAASSGRPPGWVNSAVRWLMVSWFGVIAIFVSAVPLAIAIISGALVVATYAPIVWDGRYRGWHDRLADTIVVRAGR